MFSNKKSNLPPRPNIPNLEHIMEDLDHAAVDDIAFKIIKRDESTGENVGTGSPDTYQTVRTYLTVKEQLKHLETNLQKKEEQLRTDTEEIKRLADDIKKQAQAALIT